MLLQRPISILSLSNLQGSLPMYTIKLKSSRVIKIEEYVTVVLIAKISAYPWAKRKKILG